MHSQILFSLARTLRDGEYRWAPSGSCLPALSSLAVLLAEEKTAKLPPRELLIRAFEVDYPGHAEMIKQAMEMRALVVIGRVNESDDVRGFSEGMLEELLSNRLIITCEGRGEVDELAFPRALVEPALCRKLSAVALVLNNVSIADKEAKAIIRALRKERKGTDAYWRLVEGIHMASSEVGREAMAEIQELLLDRKATLKSLDLSYTSIDPLPFVGVMESSSSLTAIDVRKVPMMDSYYRTVGELLLKPGSALSLGYMRCDAFEVLEDEPVLSLSEQSLCETRIPGGLKLLAGLLTNNTTVRELDLTASEIGPAGAADLVTALASNTGLTKLKLKYNPELDDKAKDALRAAAQKHSPPLYLEL